MQRRWPNATYVRDDAAAAAYVRRAFDPSEWRADRPLRVVLIGSDFEVRVWETLLRIPLGKGVCGSAAQQRQTVLVPDVHAFPGHIACDGRSQSEVVVPVFDAAGALIAVLDVDSDRPAAFDEVDAHWLEKIVRDTFAV